ncbi:MAG: serine hydrolase [Clostridiaceae bacterium]|nr:serine hydrolase [Clostridiaceae bacterium]
MKKAASLIIALALVMMTGCADINLNFSGVSPFRNIRDEQLIESINNTVDEFIKAEGITDISVGVLSGKEARFINRGDNINEHTKLPIGQMTTMFAGILVSNFEYNRWLGADEYVSDWLKTPEQVPRYNGERIKVWQLACNMSGLGDFDTFGKNYATAGMMYNQLENAEVKFEPGSEHYNSTLGYVLLCETIRQAYNINSNFVNLINNQVIVKMDLQNSAFERKDALAAYDGYESTTYDLLKVVGYCTGSFEYDEGLTKTISGALEERWSDGTGSGSLAFNIDKTGDNTVYFKAGSGDESVSYIAFIPELGIGVSINAMGSADLSTLAGSLLGLVK